MTGAATETVEFTAPPRVARFTVGPYRLAVDARLVEQVLDEPLDITPIPNAPRHVPGAVRVRDVGVPLLDIAALFGGDSTPWKATRHGLTMLVAHDGGRFAVPVDTLVGLSTAHASQYSLVDVQHDSAGGVFSHLFAPAGESSVDVLLDVPAIVRIHLLHTVLARTGETSRRRINLRSTCFVVRIGETRLAFDALTVRQVQAKALIDPVSFPHKALLGFYQFGRERISVVELASVLNLPASAADHAARRGARSLIVIGDERGAPVAMAVDEILDMEQVTAHDIQAMAGDDGTDHTLYRGTYVSARLGPVIVANSGALWLAGTMVDSRALFAVDEVSADAHSSDERETMIVYRVSGGLLASRICDARAVLALPSDFVDLRGTSRALVGVFTHRQRTVQVMDLSALMGRDAMATVQDRPVIVLPTARGLLGLLVDEVLSMHNGVVRSIPGASRRPHGVVPAFTEMVQVRVEGAERGVSVLALDALADHEDLMRLVSLMAHDLQPAPLP